MRILFNPRCSKCRALGALLDERGVAWEPVDYLGGALTKDALREVILKLGCRPAEIIRWDDRILTEKGISRASNPSDEALIDLMIAHPAVIQRPIAIMGGRAVIARPPERALEIL